MYPLKAIMVGFDEPSSQRLRCELINASVLIEAEFLDVGPAIDAMKRSSDEARLLVFNLVTTENLGALRRLSAQFPGFPLLVLVKGYDPKATLGEVVVSIIRAGASQIVALPIRPAEFQESLERIAVQFVYSAVAAKVVAVAGVTGGSGATTLALNLAFEIADRHGLRCVLVDLSLRMGVIASHLNIQPNHSIDDLLRDTGRIDAALVQQALIPVTENFRLLAGPPTLMPPTTARPSDVKHIVDMLKKVADVIVLDVPCTYDTVYFETLATASRAVMVGEQTLPSVRALKMVREAINRSPGTVQVVVNRFDRKSQAFSVDRLTRPLGVSTLRTVARDDAAMLTAMGRGCTLRLAAPRSPALADIVALTDVVLDADSPSRDKTVGLFRRLGRALANS